MNKLKRIQQILLITACSLILFGFMIANLLVPDRKVSVSERRPLATPPVFTWARLWEGTFFSELETYSLDQFVLRDSFRKLNALVRYDFLFQKDNNQIFIKDNAIYKMEFPLNEQAVQKTAEVYERFVQKYFADTDAKLYYSIIPDKNYYTAAKSGHLAMDYDALYEQMHASLKDMKEIDVRPYLCADDYYRTDLHWDQSKIIDIANFYLEELRAVPSLSDSDFTRETYEGFKGSYYGQSALSIKPDTLTLLTNNTLEQLTAINYETGKSIPLYDRSLLNGVDAYDIFLGGPKALLEIKNPYADRQKQLVIIRDSFSSSLAPLLVNEYSSIVLVDLRYLATDYVGAFVEFENDCDVLFLHNTLIVNQYGVLK